MLDVGSGEMGFYTYRFDAGSKQVSAEGVLEPKLKYNKGQTFADHFVREAGPEMLRAEIERRFGVHKYADTGTTEPTAPLLMCLTGANRQILRDSADGCARLQRFLKALNELICPLGLTCTAYFPRGADEAMYELYATRYVVQYGDLDRSRLRDSGVFSGTLSAGSGSCQMTLCDGNQAHSIPIGNRTPLVSMRLTDGHALFDAEKPLTREKAIDLLCNGNEAAEETRHAWAEEGEPVDPRRLQLWSDLVRTCATEHNLPPGRRGLFVGISAVYYAAAEAGCEGQILERDVFLDCLERRCTDLLRSNEPKGRVLANLTLIISVVGVVLDRSAWIVCKRNWAVGNGAHGVREMLATWTLGLFLHSTGLTDELTT